VWLTVHAGSWELAVRDARIHFQLLEGGEERESVADGSHLELGSRVRSEGDERGKGGCWLVTSLERGRRGKSVARGKRPQGAWLAAERGKSLAGGSTSNFSRDVRWGIFAGGSRLHSRGKTVAGASRLMHASTWSQATRGGRAAGSQRGRRMADGSRLAAHGRMRM
jgi:hypothetical protein